MIKKSFGDRSFSVAAPTLWNALPGSLRNIDSVLRGLSNTLTNLCVALYSIMST